LLFENALRLFSVVPEIGSCGYLGEFFDPLLLTVEVKDASGAVRGALLGGSIVQRFLLAWASSYEFVRKFITMSL
jgi:hypothetical protein